MNRWHEYIPVEKQSVNKLGYVSRCNRYRDCDEIRRLHLFGETALQGGQMALAG